MSGRPPGPKRQAAIAERDKLQAQGLPAAEIRQLLIQSSLTKTQALELVPLVGEEIPKPITAKPVTDDTRQANMEGCIHFLETIAKRLTPGVCDRFTELGPLKGDALTWASKLRGVM